MRKQQLKGSQADLGTVFILLSGSAAAANGPNRFSILDN
jgi:hypothetical protein